MRENERQPIAERSILALMLHDRDQRKRALSEGLTSEHFVAYRPVFAAIEAIHREGGQVDAATVAAWINPGDFPDFESSAELDRIDAQTPDPSGWRSWVMVLRRAYASRIATEASRFAAEESDPEAQRSALEAATEAMREALSGPSGAVDAKTACGAFLERMRELEQLGRLPGLSTGIDPLDVISGGMRPGELWACLGPTSGGKTVLMSQIALSVLLAEKRVAFFSCEMLVDEIIARAVANVGNVDLTTVLQPARWKEKRVGRTQGERIVEAVRSISQGSAWFDDTPRMTMRHIESECQRLSDQNDGLDLIVVDYMQIVTPEAARKETREQEVARVSGALKQLAKQQGCPVLSASQLNDDGRVRESRAISFDANVLLGIEDEGIRIVKMRNGRRDGPNDEPSLRLKLNGALQRFE